MSYLELLSGRRTAGRRVAILGAGGIGFDAAEFLTAPETDTGRDPEAFLAHWSVDPSLAAPGGLLAAAAGPVAPARQVTLLQRKESRLGQGLGLSTGWVLRLELQRRGVGMIAGAVYERIDGAGLHYTIKGERKLLAVDSVVVCIGQESARGLHDALRARGRTSVHLIGGAEEAAGIDALKAIDQGTRVGLAL